MFDLINKLSLKAYSGCNLNCVYCHQLFDDKNNDNIFTDYQLLEKFLLEIPLSQQVDVTITGGEITLRPDCFMEAVKVFDKIERKREVKFDKCMVSNGTNMDIVYEWCDKKIVRPDKVAISWDGLYSASKSRFTKGKYDDEFFQNVIRELGQTKYNESIAITIAITPQTLPDLYDSFKFCFDNNVFNVGYYFIHEADYNNEDLMKTFKEQIEKIAQLVVERINKGDYISYYNWQLIKTKRLHPSKFFLCGKLGNNYHIDTNGDIYPCIYFGDHRVYKLGSLKDGLDNFLLKAFTREYLVYPKCKFKTCNCVQCSECPASNLVHNHSLGKRFCNLCQLLPIENEIYDKYASQIDSIYIDHLYVPNDMEKYGSSINENIFYNGSYQEVQNRSESCSGIKSPHYEGVRQWSNYHQ